MPNALTHLFVLSFSLSHSLSLSRSLSIYIRGVCDKFPDFFPVGTFIDSIHMKLKSPSK